MKAAFYVVNVKGRWKAHITIDLRADLLWWTSRFYQREGENRKNGKNGEHREFAEVPAAEQLILLGIGLPLGKAAAWRDELNTAPQRVSSYKRSNDEQYGRFVNKIGNGDVSIRGMKGRIEGTGGTDRFDSIKNFASLEKEKESLIYPVCLYDRQSGLHSQWAEWCIPPDGEKGYAEAGRFPSASEVERFAALIAGRSLLQPELRGLLEAELPELAGSWRTLAQLAQLAGHAALMAGVAPPARGRRGLAGLLRGPALPRCRRCGSEATRTAPCASCGQSGCAYCEACLAMGRSRSCALLLRGSATPRAAAERAARTTAPTGPQLDRWGLSPAQREAAAAALRFLDGPSGDPRRPARFLLWAVTGAGKTEMIFPLLAHVLEAGGRALVATPRRDVVLELAPRLAKVFPQEEINVLYGGSEDRWHSANLVLATTHQLLRFHKAFDLVIIDELDAFPYHNDPMLAYAAESSCKDTGHFIFLSATPPKNLQRDAAAGRCGAARVPARFHGFALPVPKRIQTPGTAEAIRRQRLAAELLSELRESLRRGAQIFLFISRIQQIDPLVKLLRAKIPGVLIEGTSSRDGGRAAKVLAFRCREIRILITTTILERGVTVARSDVFILDADSGLFDEASLVQMAGRAGRSEEDPGGRVFFYSAQQTSAQREAIRQIKQMNRIALSKGYLSSPDQSGHQ